MKKSEDIKPFYYLRSEMQKGIIWDSLSDDCQASFRKLFIDDEGFKSLCKVLLEEHSFYAKEEGDILRRISLGLINSEDEIIDCYSFVLNRHLWHPFQVLYGGPFYIFPYHSIPSNMMCDHSSPFYNLNYNGTNIAQNLVGTISIARLIKTFIAIPETAQQFSIEIKKTILHPRRSYSLLFNSEINLFTVIYGMGIDTRYYPDIDVLLSWLCFEIEDYRAEIMRSLPPLKAKDIIETIRFDNCHNNISNRIITHRPTYKYRYPYFFSLDRLRDFKLSREVIPF